MYQEVPVTPNIVYAQPGSTSFAWIGWTLFSAVIIVVLILVYRMSKISGIYSLTLYMNGTKKYVRGWAKISSDKDGKKIELPHTKSPLLKMYKFGRFNGLGWALTDANQNSLGSIEMSLLSSELVLKLDNGNIYLTPDKQSNHLVHVRSITNKK